MLIALLRHVIIDILVVACFLEALLGYYNCMICYFIRIRHSPPWRAHLHPMFMILLGIIVQALVGVVNVL